MTDIAAVLTRNYPGSLWSLTGDTYEGLVWQSDAPIPTAAELDAAWPTVRDAMAWDAVRAKRDSLLAASDWTQVADAPVDAAAWAVYRQQLRDVPQSFDDPADVEWPIPPA